MFKKILLTELPSISNMEAQKQNQLQQEIDVGALREKLAHAQPKFVDYREAIRRIVEFVGTLEALDANTTQFPLYCYRAALKAQAVWLAENNDKYLNMPVPWDQSGFPSHPSMTADATAYAKGGAGALAGMLSSFSGWAPIKTQNMVCQCEQNSGAHTLTIMMNHICRAIPDGLRIKQLIGIAADDDRYFKSHYDVSSLEKQKMPTTPSKSCDMLYVGAPHEIEVHRYGPDSTGRLCRTFSFASRGQKSIDELDVGLLFSHLKNAAIPLDEQFANLVRSQEGGEQ